MTVTGNACPVCNTRNELEAIVCGHCGASLNDSLNEFGHKTKTTDMEAVTPEMIRDWSLKNAVIPEAPEIGIAVYIEGKPNPAHIDTKEEFVLGRKAGMTEGLIVDFGPFGAYSLGLSRRHVAIRRSDHGYDVMDLGSVNGTWLNEERLIPHKTYRLPSGSHLRLGRMQIFVLYRPLTETKKE